jgi:hypothetical protein
LISWYDKMFNDVMKKFIIVWNLIKEVISHGFGGN